MKRFALVKISTTRNVEWLSGPAGRPANPNNIWSVVGGVGQHKLMLASDETLIIIPSDDVMLIADYDTKYAIEKIRKIRSKADLKENTNG